MKRARRGTTDHAAGPAGRRRKVGRPKGKRRVSDSIDLRDKDLAPRRKVQSRYRDLIINLQLPHLREVSPDAQLLLMATNLGKEKATQMSAVCTAFDPIAMAKHLLSFMDLNRLEDEQNWGTARCYLNLDAWHTLARRAECCFKTAPTFHYMRGLFHAELPPPKQRRLWQTKASTKDAKKIMPTQLVKIKESNQETTEAEVERIWGYLKSYYQDGPKSPLSYYEFVTDPNSFSQTIETTFNTSFLIRDGFARIYLDDEMPCIAPVEEGEEKAEAGGSNSCNQCIITMSPKMWREIIHVLDIKDAMIKPPNTQSADGVLYRSSVASLPVALSRESVWEQSEEITEASSLKERQGETDGFSGGEGQSQLGKEAVESREQGLRKGGAVEKGGRQVDTSLSVLDSFGQKPLAV
ncbi:EP300-interacting inhibitor of differentiation 3-like [Limanda limanda]|uniref:EP300-interacting inhibitor of differentiation 3-like n=1 Tax=Limanda limanda TaxID=27771 RepID=UPI0029C86F7B|nr:EP300-interacting inhibitor of differentiation 3-like [Limanda limanda]